MQYLFQISMQNITSQYFSWIAFLYLGILFLSQLCTSYTMSSIHISLTLIQISPPHPLHHLLAYLAFFRVTRTQSYTSDLFWQKQSYFLSHIIRCVQPNTRLFTQLCNTMEISPVHPRERGAMKFILGISQDVFLFVRCIPGPSW